MTCSKCGGKILGDGYTSVLHCEFAEEETYEYMEPDADVVECTFMLEKEHEKRRTPASAASRRML